MPGYLTVFGVTALEHAFSPVPGAMERARDAGIGITLQHALVYSMAGNMRTYWGEGRTSNVWLHTLESLVGFGSGHRSGDRFSGRQP